MSKNKNKEYLGDGVYADFTHGTVKLTAEDGIQVTAGPIFIDHDILAALIRYVDRMKGAPNG